MGIFVEMFIQCVFVQCLLLATAAITKVASAESLCPNSIYTESKQLLQHCFKSPDVGSKPTYCWKTKWFQELTRSKLVDFTEGYLTKASACNQQCLCQIKYDMNFFRCGNRGTPVTWLLEQPIFKRNYANCQRTKIPEFLSPNERDTKFSFSISAPTTNVSDSMKSFFNISVQVLEMLQGNVHNLLPILSEQKQNILYFDIIESAPSSNRSELFKLISEMKRLEILSLRYFIFDQTSSIVRPNFTKSLRFMRFSNMPMLKLPEWLNETINLEYFFIASGSDKFILDFPRWPYLTTFTYTQMFTKNFTIKFKDISTLLERIDLSFTPIEYFHADTFAGLNRVYALDITATAIVTIWPLTNLHALVTFYFNGLSKTRDTTNVFCSGAKLNRNLDRAFFRSFPKLKLLEMNNYKDLNVSDDALFDSNELESINVQCNGYYKVPAYLVNNCKLKEIFLDNNLMNDSIESIPLSVVSNWRQIRTFQINNNKFPSTPLSLVVLANYLYTSIRDAIAYSVATNMLVAKSPCELYKIRLSPLYGGDYFTTTLNETEIAACKKSYDALMAQYEKDINYAKSQKVCGKK